jgi:hypothetical protein
VFNAYCEEYLWNNERPYSKSSFYALWNNCYHYVRIRKHSALSGKCVTCSKLDQASGSTNDNSVKQEISRLLALHLASIGQSKAVYYANRDEARGDRKNVYSVIADGMAQIHNTIPNLGNRMQITTLDTHLQATLSHNNHFMMVRTFGNIQNGANLAIHVFLMDLQKYFLQNGFTLPPKVYFQIDGGSENVNKHSLAMFELIVASRLTYNLNVSRLPPGHTHEDIDAMFSIISRHNRDIFILSPTEHKNRCTTAFSTEKRQIEFRDVMVLPDYCTWIDSACTNELTSIRNFAKGDNGQLLWRYQAVDRCKEFPLGVRTQYRAYAIDDFYEIRDANNFNLKEEYIPKSNFVKFKVANDWLPAKGFSIMTNFPTANITPMDFVDGCWENLDNTIRGVKSQFGSSSPFASAINEDWDNLALIFPRSVNAAAYLATHNM